MSLNDAPDTHDYAYSLNIDFRSKHPDDLEAAAARCVKAQRLLALPEIQIWDTWILSHKPIRSSLLKRQKGYVGPRRQKRILDLFKSDQNTGLTITTWELPFKMSVDTALLVDAFAVLVRKAQRVAAVCMSEAQFHQLVWKGVDQMRVRKPEVCCGAWVATLWGAPILLSENVGRRVVLVPDTGKKADCFALGSYIAPEFIYV
jgi:hypothetical protein